MSLEFTEMANLARLAAGGSPGPSSSLQKNVGVDIQQEMTTLKLEAIGYYAAVGGFADDPNWAAPEHARGVTARYLNARAASIFGGSKEVQKNIIAKAVLGL